MVTVFSEGAGRKHSIPAPFIQKDPPLLGAPGHTTRSKKLLGAPGMATSNKKLLETINRIKHKIQLRDCGFGGSVRSSNDSDVWWIVFHRLSTVDLIRPPRPKERQNHSGRIW